MQFVEVGGVALEYTHIGRTKPNMPALVFLHEGLGSVAMWKDFPAQVADATGAEVLVYSRRGYGKSDRLAGPRGVDYMHVEARDVLPELLNRLGIARPVLVGHSDGASIALIYAGLRTAPVAGLVLMAPHVFVEDLTVASIDAAKNVYRTTDMARKLGRYHADPDHAFWGWNDIWLLAAFRDWNIEALVPGVDAPMLVIQGADDEYGTAAQYESIRRLARTPCEVAVLPDCGHSPHRDQPAHTRRLIADFVCRVSAAPYSKQAATRHRGMRSA